MNLSTLLAGLLLICGVAQANEKNFAKKHPRRAEVAERANNEEKKNADAEKSGAITQGQENKLNRQDQRIKEESRRDAAKNGGSITPAEQARMNRQENRVNGERNRMEKRDAAAKGATTPPAAATPPPAAATPPPAAAPPATNP